MPTSTTISYHMHEYVCHCFVLAVCLVNSVYCCVCSGLMPPTVKFQPIALAVFLAISSFSYMSKFIMYFCNRLFGTTICACTSNFCHRPLHVHGIQQTLWSWNFDVKCYCFIIHCQHNCIIITT